MDAAVAAAATLGVTEPYSAGIGGGGFFVFYDAKRHRVSTIDGRETAPAAMRADAFAPGGVAIPFAEAVTSGLSVGVPGTLATWQSALKTWGTRSLGQALKPATVLARDGFVVDQTFRKQTVDNAARFSAFPATRHLTVADRWGNVVAYTLTIEQTGGSGIVVPGRGFLLNNELTDFNVTDTQGGHDPNLPAPGKRPRSSMAPTIVPRDGRPWLAVGSPRVARRSSPRCCRPW